MTQDKVDLVIGGILEMEMAPINEVTEAAGVLYAQANANIPGAPQDVGPDKPLQVRPFYNHDDTGPPDLDYVAKTYPQVKKIAISAPDIGYEGMIEMLTADADRAGDGDCSGREMALGNHRLRSRDDQTERERSLTLSGPWSAGRRTTS